MPDVPSLLNREHVNALYAAGLCVLPADVKAKRPYVSWEPYTKYSMPYDKRSFNKTFECWSPTKSGICIVCGQSSRRMECIDFDEKAVLFDAWHDLVDARAPGLVDRCLIETTQSGGKHLVYRCEVDVPGNKKLAVRKADKKALVETRGQGGLIICAPSPGYEVVQGSFLKLPVLTKAEREILIQSAEALTEIVAPKKAEAAHLGVARMVKDGRPGDEYNERGDVRGLLVKHGWTLMKPGDNEYWRRPGKTEEQHSATYNGHNLYVFSTNAAPFDVGEPYSPFAVYTHLEHGGDFGKAARALAAEGYGEQRAVDAGAVKAKAGTGLIITPFSEIVERPVPWLWKNWLAKGVLTVIGSKQGGGKSFLMCDLAARLSRGEALPGGDAVPQSRVLILSREDAADFVLRPRLRAAGAVMENVDFSAFNDETGPLDLSEHVQELAVRKGEWSLIVVDTYAAFSPDDADANSQNGSRRLLNALTALAEGTGAAVLTACHLQKKVDPGSDPMHWFSGSAQMTACARTAWLLEAVPAGDGSWIRVVKNNLGPLDGSGFLVDREPVPGLPPRLKWTRAGEAQVQADAMRRSGRIPVDAEAVCMALQKVLARGPKKVSDASDRVWASLRSMPGMTEVRKQDVFRAVEDVLENTVFSRRRDGRREMCALAGHLPETGEDRARRLLADDPTLTGTALAELSGIRKAKALELIAESGRFPMTVPDEKLIGNRELAIAP
jgi:hypothetical protein